MSDEKKPRTLDLSGGPNFKDELAALTRRMERLKALQDGKATVKRIEVEGGWVKRHYRIAHTRALITITKPKPATTKRRGK